MVFSSIIWRAWANKASGWIVVGRGLRRLEAFQWRMSESFNRARRRSPSTIIPLSFRPGPTTQVEPTLLALISRTIFRKEALKGTFGTALPLRMISATLKCSRRPSSPAGWKRAKSFSVNPWASIKATARASPMAKAAVVLAVGANLKGQASFLTPTSTTISLMRAMEEWRLPVKRTTRQPMRFNRGRRVFSSSVPPLLERARTTSPLEAFPMSPWRASAGLKKRAGVPVEERVAAIFWPTSPDFPMPVTTTRPLDLRMSFTALSKEAPALRESWSRPSASIFRTFFAVDTLIMILMPRNLTRSILGIEITPAGTALDGDILAHFVEDLRRDVHVASTAGLVVLGPRHGNFFAAVTQLFITPGELLRQIRQLLLAFRSFFLGRLVAIGDFLLDVLLVFGGPFFGLGQFLGELLDLRLLVVILEKEFQDFFLGLGFFLPSLLNFLLQGGELLVT